MNVIKSNFLKLKSLLLSTQIEKKIVVIESDDWGSVRMPNPETYKISKENGYPMDRNVYTKYDCLESGEDLDKLFNLLIEYKDKNDKNPIITANFLVTNPDFNKIISSNYSNYYFETIIDTYNNGQTNALNKIMSGKNAGLVLPQSHGREHLNVKRIMNDLASNIEEAKFAIDHFMPGIINKTGQVFENNYVVALENSNSEDLISKKRVIQEGLDIFYSIFGYQSESFIACNYVWDPEIEIILKQKNVKYIQGSTFQKIPKGNHTGFELKMHYTGEINDLGQLYLVRNAHFEPVYGGIRAVESCLKQLNRAFLLGLPGIISTHRINYVSGMAIENRENGIKHLNILIKQILRKWPDVEFMTSVELGNYLINNK